MKKKRILVANDDGINAAGLIALTAAISQMPDCEAYVFAPKEQQSAKSHSVTFLRTVEAEKCSVPGASEAWAVDGTPADCVKLGLVLMRELGMTPDYVFSGINLGHNMGMSAYYSGTIGAAREGALNGIRSAALSVKGHDASEFGAILSQLPKIMELADTVDPDTFLSVNAPAIPAEELKGIRIAAAAPYGYAEDFVFLLQDSHAAALPATHEQSSGADQELSYTGSSDSGEAALAIQTVTGSAAASSGMAAAPAAANSRMSAASATDGATASSTILSAAGSRMSAAPATDGTTASSPILSAAGSRQTPADTSCRVFQLTPTDIYKDDKMLYDFDWMELGYVTFSPIPTTLEAPAALDALKKAAEKMH